MVFYSVNFRAIGIIVFNKKLLHPIKDIDFLSSNLKRYFASEYIFGKFWGFENCQVGHVLDQFMRALKSLFIMLRA